MERVILIGALATAGLISACTGLPAGNQMTAMHASAIRDSVQATLDAFRRYSAEGQWDSLAGLYANDESFRWMEQGVVQYRSPAQIREALRRMSRSTQVETSYLDTQIRALAPGVAVVTTTFFSKFVNAGRAGAEYGGVLDLTFVHGETGWQILVGHSSSRPR